MPTSHKILYFMTIYIYNILLQWTKQILEKIVIFGKFFCYGMEPPSSKGVNKLSILYGVVTKEY